MYHLLTSLLFFSLATYNIADLSHSYLNHQCKIKEHLKPFKCPKFDNDLIRIDVATFYQPISRDCLNNCSIVPAYTKKVIYNEDWIVPIDWSVAYKVYPLYYNPQCYPEGTFIVDGNVPVSLLKDRLNFESTFNYTLKKGNILYSMFPCLVGYGDVVMPIEKKEFLMFLAMYLMKDTVDYDHKIHQNDTKFYDTATDSRLKNDVVDVDKAQKLLNTMYSESMEMLIESTEVEWNRLCEAASSEKGKFYEEVIAAEN